MCFFVIVYSFRHIRPRTIDNFIQNGQLSDLNIFRDFEGDMIVLLWVSSGQGATVAPFSSFIGDMIVLLWVSSGPEDQRAYLIGKRYKEEKKEQARPKFGNKVATIANLLPINRPTENIIADQSNVSPRTVRNAEKFFDNEHEVINWIIDNQLSRRNITDDQRAYLIGKRHKEEKKAIGANSASIKEQVKQINKHVIPHNEEVKDDKSTSAKIAEQSKVSHATVERAEKFADAVDKVSENTGINPQKILSGAINARGIW